MAADFVLSFVVMVYEAQQLNSENDHFNFRPIKKDPLSVTALYCLQVYKPVYLTSLTSLIRG